MLTQRRDHQFAPLDSGSEIRNNLSISGSKDGSAIRAYVPYSTGRRAALKRGVTLIPHDQRCMPIEGVAREAQGQTHRALAAIGSGEGSNTRGL